MQKQFEITKQSKDKLYKVSKLKLGTIVDLPRFMPVATYASMKAVPFDHIDTNLILCNAYHCRNLKNLKLFMQTEKNILTDSGGFQIGSLENVRVEEEGVYFDDNQLFTPEDSINVQKNLGSDIIMQLDEVVNPLSEYSKIKDATLRSIRWLERCLEEFNKEESNDRMNDRINGTMNEKVKKIKKDISFFKNDQILCPIIQGGCYEDLRILSIESILRMNPGMIAIGGLSGGENKIDMFRTILNCVKRVKNIPIYVMGIGYPEDVLLSFALGCDMMDCVYPTRTARFGKMFTDYGDINLMKDNSKGIREGIIERGGLKYLNCKCFTCKNYSLEYIDFIKGSSNFCTLISVHNLFFMNELGNNVRKNISNDTFESFVKEFLEKRYFYKEIPSWIKDVLKWVNINI